MLALVSAGCGRSGEPTSAAPETERDSLSGTIEADGSSTVGPLVTAAAESFRGREPGVRVTVGVSGTGGGFERFCAGEIDLSNASRPIKQEEVDACAEHGVEYVELHVANDALTLVVNKDNDWVSCLTVEQLRRIWEPGSKVGSWRDVEGGFPDEPLKLFGAGTDSGTFDFFTKAIVGEEGASRSDYAATEDDNVTVQGVSGERGGLGYFGLSYYEQNAASLKALAVDGGGGCVAPSVASAQDGSYTPLSRPLYVYATVEALARPEIAAFLHHLLDEGEAIAALAQFVPLTDEQLATARAALDEAVGG
ncbi:MAG: PstS family phosphate ABC transporter substrate-binding protein [Actinobacteria bacterium]|nr:PstS family phosphate ABC transporter substrate-binding protein [Actinomycetota bacterium]